MSALLPDPERWTTRPAGGHAAEDGFARALRSAAEATLHPTTEPGGARARSDRGIRARRALLGPGTAALLGLLGAGAVFATNGILRDPAARGPAEVPATPPTPLTTTPTTTSTSTAPATPATPHSPRPALPRALTPARPARVARAGLRRTLAEREPAAPAPGEIELLARALQQLRAARDPAAALAALDEHALRFPLSELQQEADLARAEALLQLGRRSEALQLLRALPPETRRQHTSPPAP